MMKQIWLSILLCTGCINTCYGQVSYTQNVFAFVGDYGTDTPEEDSVARLIKSWTPEAIFTQGDNNYENGNAADIDRNIGKYFHDYINPYTGSYGPAADKNRFWPALGNHDLMTASGAAYYNYFTLPGNERYYDVIIGNIHFFSINSDPSEPDGISANSIQANWLKTKLQNSNARWKIVYGHHPPFSSDINYGNNATLQWPYHQWGADVVLSGHAHVYERLNINGVTYLTNGLGSRVRYGFQSIPHPGSVVRYNSKFGALRLKASSDSLHFRFYSINNDLVDNFYLAKTPLGVNVINNSGQREPLIFPNPGNGAIAVNFQGSEFGEGIVSVTIMDLLGKKVWEAQVTLDSNQTLYRFDLSDLQSGGLFFIQFKSDEAEYNSKFVLLR